MNRRSLLRTLATSIPIPAAIPLIAEPARPSRRRKILILHTRLAGFRYHEGPAQATDLRPGQPLTLVREPTNPHDPNAVRVDWRGHSLGYLPRHHNQAPARLLDEGERLSARVTSIDFVGDPWRPMEVDIYLKLPDGTSADNAS